MALAVHVPESVDEVVGLLSGGGTVIAGGTHVMPRLGHTAELVSFCSHSFTLDPGDVIVTGTPWGCGEFMEPKRSLKHGDVVECEIEGIGVLRNPVVEI